MLPHFIGGAFYSAAALGFLRGLDAGFFAGAFAAWADSAGGAAFLRPSPIAFAISLRRSEYSAETIG